MDTPPAGALDLIREEIDAIDDAMLALLAKRFAAVAEVKRIKAASGAIAQSPIRPAREAAILRRLVQAKPESVPSELRVRLWRAIISASTLLQAPVRIHLGKGLFDSVPARLMLRDHFGTTPLAEHPGEAQVLAALAGHHGDVAVVALESPWLDPYLDGRANQARVIASLPQVAGVLCPKCWSLDRLRLSRPAMTRPCSSPPASCRAISRRRRFGRCGCGNRHLASLPGFLSETSQPLIGLMRSNVPLALMVLGRYPSPIEVRS